VRVWHYNNADYPVIGEDLAFYSTLLTQLYVGVWNYNNAAHPVLGEGLAFYSTLFTQL